MNIEYIFLAGFGIMLASLLGVLFVAKQDKATVSKNLPYFISFSAGVFLFTTGYLILESYHIFENVFIVLGLVVAGYTIASLVVFLVPRMHHHHADEHCDGHTAKGKNVLIGDAIHNIADGLILVPAFMISPILGFGTAISLFVHEALQEVSEFFVLKEAGFSTKKALFYNFAVSSTILIGIVIGLFFSETVFIQGVLLALSAGFFAYIISHDLVPHKRIANRSKDLVIHMGILVLGVLLIGLVNVAFGDEHTHAVHDKDEHAEDMHAEEDHSEEDYDEHHEEDHDH